MEACDWPLNYSICGDPGWDAEEQELFEEIAVDFLWLWTERQFGVCTVTLRPCNDCCGESPSTFYGGGPRVRSTFFDTGRACCSYMGRNILALPGRVDSVNLVQIGTQTLPESAYRVDNSYLLVRQDGGEWPQRQNHSAPAGTPGTFVVEYSRGAPVPKGGQLAAARLASEFYKAHCGDKSCALPQRVQSVTRQGVTMAILDAFDDIDTGHTGIWAIDSWVASVTKPRRPSFVRSVDVPLIKRRRQTWP